MNNRLLSLLGMARRCGKMSAGFDAVCDAVKAGQSSVILISSDIAPRSERNIQYAVQNTGVRVVKVQEDKALLGHAMGLAPTAIVSLNEKGFAAKALQLAIEATDSTGHPVL